MHPDDSDPKQQPEIPRALMPLEACVDRVLSDLAAEQPLRGCVQIGPLPQLRCDGVALREAMTVVLREFLEQQDAHIRIRWETHPEGHKLIFQGVPTGVLVEDAINVKAVVAADEFLRPADGMAWSERKPGAEVASVCFFLREPATKPSSPSLGC